ncbi:pentatricopeptide repeat-containing protein At1g09900 [Selaginella moellendorffii]|nr:pentatricopeptide repeat-containing protein At1g09900 [Selaginella moellendorffii]|eukprot:XP_002986602.2 pentatricopeptide repeat-containing protein At1g09900 [Selaginella moellendorffii]
MALLAGAIPVAIASSSSTSLAPVSCSAQAVQQNVSFRKNASATAAEEQILSGQRPGKKSRYRRKRKSQERQPGELDPPVNIAVVDEDSVTEICKLLESRLPEGILVGSLAAFQGLYFSHIAVCKILQRTKDPDVALAFFQWLTREACYKPNTVAYNCLLNTLIKAGRIHQVREMLNRKTLGEFVHSEFTYGTLVHGHCLAGEFDEAKRLVEEFKDTGMSPGSLVVLHNLMLKGFSEAGFVDEAKSHLHRMDCKPNSVSYNTLIDALCSSGRIQEAREELQAMAKRGVAPNRVTYNAMATGLGKAGLLDEAFELMGVMESAGFALTAVTFNPVVEFLCKSGRPDEACKVMETMLLRNIEPNILTLNLILHAFCKAARPEEALGMTDIMVEMGFCPTIVTFNALLELFCNTDQMDSAAKLLETMAHSKCKPNFVTYSIMVQKFAEMGRMVEARAFLEQLVVCGYAPNLLVCNAYVAGLCKTGEMDLASRFLTVMAEEGCRANTATYNSLVEGFCKLGRMDEAERVLEEMIAEGSLPDSTTYSVLIQGLCSAGQIEHAFMVMLQVTRAVESARPDPATFVKLIEKLCELGEMDRAALVLERMGDEHEEFRVCQVLISNSQH